MTLADIEDEIYSADYDQKVQSKKEIKFEQNLSFQNLITCVFKTSDYKRLFRFGITENNEFFYRKVLLENKKSESFGGEFVYLTKNKSIYFLEIDERDFDKLILEINFDNKQSKLTKNSKLIKRVNCN
jgi:hypothetical protein